MDTTKRTAPLWREALGETLRAERHDQRRRLVDVAGDAGVSPQYLSELERGMKDPSSEMLEAVSGALGLPTEEIAFRAAGRLMRATRAAELLVLSDSVLRGDPLLTMRGFGATTLSPGDAYLLAA